jgi:acetyl esterase/lipase
MKYLFLFILSISMIDFVQGQQTVPLYPGTIPNSKPSPNSERQEKTESGMEIIHKISIPTLTIFLPAKPSPLGTAVIICPGGGYGINAIKHEGIDVAKKLNEWGVAAFVLKYRIPGDDIMLNKEIGPLQDAQQAIRFVRENAAKWKVDPNRLGIMGFSAGGHLAATTATHFKNPVLENVGKINFRPDFLILGYPVVSFIDTIGHMGSRDNLLGKTPSPEKIAEYSNELQVTAQTPPTFLFHASDDDAVKPANSILFYESLLKHKVPAELHIYEKGGHGFGIDNPTTQEKWMDSLQNWMHSRGLLGK